MTARRSMLRPAIGASCLLLAAIWAFWQYFSPLTYYGPHDAFSIRYSKQWEPAEAGGVVSFQQKKQPPGLGVTVTLVLSKTQENWAGNFEHSLAQAFAAVGGVYHFFDKTIVPLPAGNINRYAYSITMDGKRLKNVVYVFETGPRTAAVMTCSAPFDHDAGLERTCATFATSFRADRP